MRFDRKGKGIGGNDRLTTKSVFGELLPGDFTVCDNSASAGPQVGASNEDKAADFASYLGKVSQYGVFYTSIVLLFGLILFEDRDLA